MTVEARVDDVRLLWSGGRRESAFLIALVAVSATARKRFPDRKSVGDPDVFERFLRRGAARADDRRDRHCAPVALRARLKQGLFVRSVVRLSTKGQRMR